MGLSFAKSVAFWCGISGVWSVQVPGLAQTVDPAVPESEILTAPNFFQSQPSEQPAGLLSQVSPPRPAPANPSQNQLLPPIPRPVPLPEPSPPEIQTPPAPTEPASEPDQTVNVSKIEVSGSTIFGPVQFNPIVQPFEGRAVTLNELKTAADAITKLYLDQGYLTSRAVLPQQTIADGVIQIQVLEGQLEEIQIEGNRRLLKSYIRDRINLGAKVPLNSNALEEQLRLLKIDPLFKNIEASLRPGSQPNTSILVVRVTEAKNFSSAIALDNYIPPAIAPERGSIALQYQNLSGRGDVLSGSYAVGTNLGKFDWGASNVFDISYSIPVNAMNGALQLRTVQNSNRITRSDLDPLGLEAESSYYLINFRQPIIRTLRQEFALSLGFEIQGGQTFIFNDTPFPFGIGPDANGVSRTRVLQFGQDWLRRDQQGAWLLRSQFNFGLGIFDATKNPAPIPDGRFFSWLGQGQRLQRLGGDNYLLLRSELQLSPNSLLPFQQFVIGGGLSVRGYAQNARSGDNGFRLSAEGRFPVLRDQARNPVLQLAPFLDLGTVWNNGSNPNGSVNQGFLAGAGLGILWQPNRHLDLRIDYALPFVNLSDRGNSLQDNGFYFSLVVRP
ncbi:MAG: ShlB/FhaC/HecB family hemolysin secretion/activation protein [Aphanocapsa sp. GSE-SYN-MK-11-07L]|jgi:hemolysin activation/secretion protein|nr:ShlB/FhaC/HecB family hemolysin secretion/activation protein [Aphanocapsa sp. GSE-SYN-MK-11-07L]